MCGVIHVRTTRGWRSLLAVVFVFGALIWVTNSPASAADPKVRIFSGTDEHWVQFQVAKAKGFFKDEGLDVLVVMFTRAPLTSSR